jgi:hypothetical protein
MHHNILTRLTIVGFALLISAGTAAQTGFSSLEERMTAREFREAGLDKLSDEELATLNRWIRDRSLAEGELPDGLTRAESTDGTTDRRGMPGESGRGDAPIQSRIVGEFSGWSGNTQFELENGMVWQQMDGRSFASRRMDNPEVEISRGLIGGWYLQVDGYNARTRVRRIR